MNPSDIPRVEAHLRGLDGLGFADLTKPLWSELSRRIDARERRTPSASDLAWPASQALSLEEHLNFGTRRVANKPGDLIVASSDSDARPPFGCGIVEGRAYELTAAQRHVLSEWFNMTPSRCVEVLQIALFPEQAVALFREVVIRTQEHQDPKNRRLTNGPRKIVLDRWGDFMSACKAREVEMEQVRESSRFHARVANLLRKAAERKVTHDESGPGSLAVLWQAQCEAQGLLFKVPNKEDEPGATQEKERQSAIREVLRCVLLSRGEQGLAKLVKEPFFLGEREEGISPDFAEVSAELDIILNQLK